MGSAGSARTGASPRQARGRLFEAASRRLRTRGRWQFRKFLLLVPLSAGGRSRAPRLDPAMSSFEMPACFSKGVGETLRLRRTAIACRAANPVALGRAMRLASSVTSMLRERGSCRPNRGLGCNGKVPRLRPLPPEIIRQPIWLYLRPGSLAETTFASTVVDQGLGADLPLCANTGHSPSGHKGKWPSVRDTRVR